MLLWLQGILTPDEVAKIRSIAASGRFVDGGASAPGLAEKGVKRNEQLSNQAKNKATVDRIVLDALYRNETFRTAAIPKRIQTPVLARYKSGMVYGTHIDNPIHDRRNPMRLDLSITIFLSDPSSYAGGELVHDTGYGDKSVKLPSGDAILYPTTMLHRVEEVKRGERLVAITWIQSMVREGAKRRILYDLALATQWAFKQAPESPEYHRLNNARANLIRMWATD